MYKEEEKRTLGLVSLDEKHNPKQSKVKPSCVTFALNNPIQIDYVLNVLEKEFSDPQSRSKYLYICHDKDINDNEIVSVHVHFVVWGTPRRFIDWANQFSIPNDKVNAIPAHMICSVRNQRSICRYLIHLDNPDKHQYSQDEVFGSSKGLDFFTRCCIDYDDVDLESEFNDFELLRYGKILPKEFLTKYRVYYSNEKFSNRLRIYSSIFENFKINGDNYYHVND